MVELIAAELAIVACHGDATALEGWRSIPSSLHVPVAADEVWLIGPRADRTGMLADAVARLPDALVVDQTDGWSAWTLAGDGAPEVLARLMLAPVPGTGPALVQGAIAGVPGKVLVGDGGVQVLVPAPVGDYLRDRILGVGPDLDIRLARRSARQPLAIGL